MLGSTVTLTVARAPEWDDLVGERPGDYDSRPIEVTVPQGEWRIVVELDPRYLIFGSGSATSRGRNRVGADRSRPGRLRRGRAAQRRGDVHAAGTSARERQLDGPHRAARIGAVARRRHAALDRMQGVWDAAPRTMERVCSGGESHLSPPGRISRGSGSDDGDRALRPSPFFVFASIATVYVFPLSDRQTGDAGATVQSTASVRLGLGEGDELAAERRRAPRHRPRADRVVDAESAEVDGDGRVLVPPLMLSLPFTGLSGFAAPAHFGCPGFAPPLFR